MAERAQMTKQSMSYLVEYLEGYGFLKREKDPSDKRAVLFVLTEKGHEAERIAEIAIKKVEKKWEREIGQKQFSLLYSLLNDLYKKL